MLPVHPCELFTKYIIECVPAFAVIGLKVLPLIPVPLNVPPVGLPVKVTADALIQYEGARPEKLTLGRAFTVTVSFTIYEHEFASI